MKKSSTRCLGDDDLVEHEPHELLASGKGHVVEPGGDLLAEVVGAFRARPAVARRPCSSTADPFQLRGPLRQRTLTALEVGRVDGAGLVGVEEPPLLGA